MAWVTNDGAGNTYNLTFSSASGNNAAAVMYRFKTLLKVAGWTVVATSDGSTHSPTGDIITSGNSGAGGMDNANAWYHLRDPSGQREIAFQRGVVNHAQWIGHYSYNDGLAGGNVTTLPGNATDLAYICQNSSTEVRMFPSTGTFKIHMAAQNEGYGSTNVYAWWILGFRTAEETNIICDPVEAPSSDPDPCIIIGSPSAISNSTLCSGGTVDSAHGWTGLGTENAVWSPISGVSYHHTSTVRAYSGSTTALADNPHNGHSIGLPILYQNRGSGDSLSSFKGVSVYIKHNPAATTYDHQDIFKVADNDYYINWKDIIVRGWPTSTLPIA
jgi:hypothetical protein